MRLFLFSQLRIRNKPMPSAPEYDGPDKNDPKKKREINQTPKPTPLGKIRRKATPLPDQFQGMTGEGWLVTEVNWIESDRLFQTVVTKADVSAVVYFHDKKPIHSMVNLRGV